MAKKSTAFAEFILTREEELRTTILPILEANHAQGIKTLIFKKDLEGTRVHVTCIGIKVPNLSADGPTYELIALQPNQEIDLSRFAKADMNPVGLIFGE